jgi:ABC-type glycerol-3-phosphate transport system substrate-binding protein
VYTRLLSLMLSLMLLLTACGQNSTALPTIPAGENGGTMPGGNSQQIIITYGAYDYDRELYATLAERFMQEHPTIKVVIASLDEAMQSQPDENGNFQQESSMSMLRRVVSMADVSPAWLLTKEAMGTPLVLDLKPYLDADTGFDRADYYPGILERFTMNGGMYSLPRTINLQALSYNKTLFETESLPLPQNSWSFDDLLATAERLAKVENGKVVRYGWFDSSGGSIVLINLMTKAGIDVLSMSPADLKSGDQRIIDVYRKYKDLVDRGVIMPPNPYMVMPIAYESSDPSLPIEGQDPVQRIRNGEIGIWSDSAMFTGDPSTPPVAFEVGSVALPLGPHVDLMTYADGYMISGGTTNPQAAWTFVEWLTRQEIPSSYMPTNYPGLVYARQSLSNQLTSTDPDAQARLETYKYSIKNLPPIKYYPNQEYVVYYNVLGGVSMMFEQPTKTPDQALDQVLVNIRDQAAYAQTTPSPTPDLRPIIMSTPVVQEAKPGQTVVKFAAYGMSLSETRRILRAFNDNEPNIFVSIVQTDNLTENLTFANLAGRTDCFWWGANTPNTATDVAAVADMQAVIDADGTIDTTEIPPALFDILTRDGRLIGFPNAYTGRALIYQPALFSAVGIDKPSVTWTADEFLKAAKAITANGVYGYSSLGNYLGDLNFWVGQFGGTLTTGSGSDLRVTFTNPNTIKAIDWFMRLHTEHNIMPKPVFYYRPDQNNQASDNSYDLMTQGKIGMWMDTSLGQFDPNNPRDPNQPINTVTAAMAPLPVGAKGVTSDVYVSAYYISAQSEQPQACMRVIDYMSKRSSTFSYGSIPARTSDATSPVFEQQNAYVIPLRDAMQEMLQQPANFTGDTYAHYSFESYWLFQALDNTLSKKADVTAELTSAERLTNAYQACVATMATSGKTNAQCAKEVDPTYKGYMADEPIARPMPMP